MFANQHFVTSQDNPYKPFHSNNMDFAIGGPIVPHHNSFFFFSVEMLRSSASAGGSVTFADPQFISYSQAKYPDTVGTHVMTTYLPSGVGAISVQQTAADVFGSACGIGESGNGDQEKEECKDLTHGR